MRLAVTGKVEEEFLAFARQIGATDYIGGVNNLPQDKGYFGFQELMLLRQRIEDAGLRWAVFDGIPAEWSYKIKLGLPGRDEQIANWCKTLENLGAAGVPALGYFFSLRSGIGKYGLRTSSTTPGRGGAKLTSFDYGFNLYHRALKDTPPRLGSTTRADWLRLPFPSPGRAPLRDSTDADWNPPRPNRSSGPGWASSDPEGVAGLGA